MFDKHHANKALAAYREQSAQWQSDRDGYANLLQLANSFTGTSATEILLKPGEAVFAKVTGASLVEQRRGAGHYQGGSSGISVPIGSIGGHSVRYHVGASRGHYVQGTPSPTAIDTGTAFVTNQRIIFQGANQTRECLFAKLIGVQHDDGEGTTTVSVSNRQKPTTIHYGPQLSGWFDFRLDLALAYFRNTLPALVAQLQADLAGIDNHKPQPPPAATQ